MLFITIFHNILFYLNIMGHFPRKIHFQWEENTREEKQIKDMKMSFYIDLDGLV